MKIFTKVLGAIVVAGMLMLVVAVPAQSVVTPIYCSGGGIIPPQDRCVWNEYKWLHGVGVTNTWLHIPGQEICVGAKTNSDGSGGNALPFRCENLAAHQTIWTPGGSSNWGYATIINRNSNQNAHLAAIMANHA